jgi:predicted esterase
MNSAVKFLFIACRGTPLAYRKDLPIKMMWNKDDDKLPYSISKQFIDVFEAQGNDFKFISYDKGGHEFNIEFINKVL